MAPVNPEKTFNPTQKEPNPTRKTPNPARKALSIPMALLLLVLTMPGLSLIEIVGDSLFLLFLPEPGYLERLWIIALLRLVDFGLILFFIYLSKQGLSAIGIFPGKWLDGISKGVLVSLGFGLLVFSTWGIFLLFHINLFRFLIPPAGRSMPLVNLCWTILIGGIFAPIVEDSFFVGCLYNALRKKFSVLWSVLGISVLFALLHGVRGIPFNQLIGGIVFTLAFEYSGSLLTPVCIHILGNCTLFTMAYSSWVKNILLP